MASGVLSILIVRAERSLVERAGSGRPVRGATGTFGAEGAVVVVVEVDDVVVVESAMASGAPTNVDATAMIDARVSERRIRATYFPHRSLPRQGQTKETRLRRTLARDIAPARWSNRLLEVAAVM